MPLPQDYAISAVTGKPGESGTPAQFIEIEAPSGLVFKNGSPNSITLNAVAVGFTPSAYVWKKNGTTISGQTTSSLTIASTDVTSSATYSVEADGCKDYATVISVSDGTNGKGISSTVIKYASSTSGTSAPSSGWQDSVPAVTAGNYLWTRTVITYTDASTSTSYAVARQGVNGTDGNDGTSVTITSKSVKYQAGTSGTTKPTGTWSTTVPSVSKGQYLWTQTIVNYSDGQSTEAYSVAYEGNNGANGTSPYACSLSNENFSIATDTDLKPLSVPTGGYSCKFTAYKGSTQLSPIAPSATIASGKFKISTPSSAGGITVAQGTNGTLTFTPSTSTAITENQTFSVTVTYDNGSTEVKEITISASKTGTKGDTGATGTRGNLTFIGTEIFNIRASAVAYTLTTASTGITSNSMAILVGDRYINSLTYDVWKCTTAGKAGSSTSSEIAKWTYEGRQTDDKDNSNQLRFFGDGTKNKYNLVSANHTQSVVVDTDPFGNQSELLKITVANNKSLQQYGTCTPYNKPIKVDSTATYRFSCYYKRNSAGQNLQDRIGILGWKSPHTQIRNLDGSSYSGWGGALQSFPASYENKWILIVGYIVGSGQTAVPTKDESGIYDVSTKARLANASNRRWVEGVTEVTHGSVILYEDNAGVTTTKEYNSYIYDLRFDKCDGSEPSLEELLNLNIEAKGKGTYTSGTIYNKGDIVYYNGNSYICKVLSTTNVPTTTADWDLVADKGEKGDTGNTGERGVDGTKTFTSDITRSWTDAQWADYSTVGSSASWNNSTVEGMRVNDIIAIPAILTEQGNITGIVYAKITSIPTSQSGGVYAIPSVTLYGQKGTRGSLTFIGTEIFDIRASAVAYTLTTASTGIISNTMSILVGDRYINSLTYDVWKCTTAGTASTAKWTYEGRQADDKDNSNQFRFFGDGTRTKYNTVSSSITQSEVSDTDPFGGTSKLWKVTRPANVSAGGYATPYTKAVKIESGFNYRYACYVKRTTSSFTDYFGARGYTSGGDAQVLSLAGASVNSAYFTSTNNFGTLNRWYLVIGYVTANGVTTAPSGSGVYDMVTKKKVKDVTNYQFKNITEYTHTGTLIGYTASATTPTAETSIYVSDIRFDKLDGTEPSLDELLDLNPDRTLAFRVNYSTFSAANNGEVYVCGYNSKCEEADVYGRVIVNGVTYYTQGMLNSNCAMNGYVAIQKSGATSSASPARPVYVYQDGSGSWYQVANDLTTAAKSAISSKADWIVIAKIHSYSSEGVCSLEPMTPCLLSDINDVIKMRYEGIVAEVTNYTSAQITTYKIIGNNGSFTKSETVPATKNVDRGALVLNTNEITPTSSTAQARMMLFDGTTWTEISSNDARYNDAILLCAGALPALAGYYYTLGLATPNICGTYIDTLTTNRAFINEAMINLICAYDINFKNSVSSYKDSGYVAGDLCISMGNNPKNTDDTDSNFLIQSYKTTVSKTVSGQTVSKELWMKEFSTKKENNVVNLFVKGNLDVTGDITSFSPNFFVGADIKELSLSGDSLTHTNGIICSVYRNGYIYNFCQDNGSTDIIITKAIYTDKMTFSLITTLSSVGALLDAMLYKDVIYLALRNGVYKFDTDNNTVTRISTNRVFGLSIIDGLLNITNAGYDETGFTFYNGTTTITKTSALGGNQSLCHFTDDYYVACDEIAQGTLNNTWVYYYDKNFNFLGYKEVTGAPVTWLDGTQHRLGYTYPIFAYNGKLFTGAQTDATFNSNGSLTNGSRTRLVISNDGGDTWEEMKDDSVYSSFAIAATGARCVNYKNCVIIQGAGSYYISYNGGNDFEYVELSELGNWKSNTPYVLQADEYTKDIIVPLSIGSGKLALSRIRQTNVAKPQPVRIRTSEPDNPVDGDIWID